MHSKKFQGIAPVLAFFVLGTILVFSLAPAGFSQGGPEGAIAGIVKDTTGASVPGATVTITNTDRNVTERTITTNVDGTFTANLLPVGNYSVAIGMSGFQTANVPNVNVKVATTTNIVVTLQVGQISQTINVEGAVTPVQLSAPTTGETIQDVGELPLATRNFLNLLALSAGTSSEMADTSALGRGLVSITVNGERPTNNNYQLEGINANDYNLPVFDNVPLPNPQAIKEFKTQTSLYDASQGRNAGGNIQVTMQSGTSKFHGNAFEFFRNNDLNANDFFLNSRRAIAPGAASEPVWRIPWRADSDCQGFLLLHELPGHPGCFRDLCRHQLFHDHSGIADEPFGGKPAAALLPEWPAVRNVD